MVSETDHLLKEARSGKHLKILKIIIPKFFKNELKDFSYGPKRCDPYPCTVQPPTPAPNDFKIVE
jgi:hypothetical protein